MIFKSIRWRLQIWYGLILVAVLSGFGFTAYRLESGRQFRRIDDELHRRINGLMNAINLPPRGPGLGDPGMERPAQPEGAPDLENSLPDRRNRRLPGAAFDRFPERLADFQLPPRLAGLFEGTGTNSYYYVIWTADGREITHSTNAAAQNVSFPRRQPGMDERQPEQRDQPPPPRRDALSPPQPPQTRGIYREIAAFGRGQVVLVGRSIAPELAELRTSAWTFVALGGGILLLGLAGGWWLAGRAIRPIEEISATAVKISGGDLSQRIDASDTESELGRLASVLNATFARLETAFTQQQQFTSDAAHELRTPVSVLLTQTQTALSRERTAPEYRETLESCQRSAQRMRRLLESLLELARMDAGQETMKRNRFGVARTVNDCVELIRPLAASRQITIEEQLATVECVGDAERIAQVVTNLLTNAVHYNNERGAIRVSTTQDGDFAVIEVADNGPGIPAEHVAHVFDRFYRVDSARTSSQGRSGLGLAISKAIVQAHGGSIDVTSEVGKGTTFTVRLPRG